WPALLTRPDQFGRNPLAPFVINHQDERDGSKPPCCARSSATRSSRLRMATGQTVRTAGLQCLIQSQGARTVESGACAAATNPPSLFFGGPRTARATELRKCAEPGQQAV